MIRQRIGMLVAFDVGTDPIDGGFVEKRDLSLPLAEETGTRGGFSRIHARPFGELRQRGTQPVVIPGNRSPDLNQSL
jgi:hypothetical protein